VLVASLHGRCHSSLKPIKLRNLRSLSQRNSFNCFNVSRRFRSTIEVPRGVRLFKTLPENLLTRLWRSSRIDFSEIQIHECDLPKRLGVPAFAHGSFLFFARGFYDPTTLRGRRLIFHELMHCVQQWSGRLQGRIGLVTDAPLEQEANSFNLCAAMVRPSTLTRKLPVFVPELPILQAAIGFEFQTGWKAFRRSTVRHRFKLPEERDTMLPRATTLFGGRYSQAGWSMETDDDEIEFVIDPPIEESEEGIRELERIFSNLYVFISRLENHRNLEQLTPKSHPSFFNPGTDRSIVIVPNGDQILAQPQITIGVRLGRVPDLFAEISRLRLQARVGLLERDGTTSNYFATQADTLATIATKAPTVNGVPASNKLRGLVALVCQYLKQGSGGGSRNYVKDIAFAMSRTDFASMFQQLPTSESQWFKNNPQRWVDYCLTAAEMPGMQGQKLIQQRITDGPNRPRPGAEIPLTRQEWLQDMVTGVDRLTKDGSPDQHGTDGYHRFRALGLLGFKFDPVGRTRQDGTRHRGVILELRQMQRNVPFSMWHAIARDILRYLIALNNSHAGEVKPQIERY
jgi:uncharacterized protein DUF4157